MGVKGLTTFIKENRQSLCETVQLVTGHNAGHAGIPVIVDAWGYVSQIHACSSH
jgi:hypothetical protein